MLTRFCVLLFLGWPVLAFGKLVVYEFDIATESVNVTGNAVTALAIDGQIPAPLITAEVGDLLRVTFHNRLSVPASIHWHGLLLPGIQDGVPFLNTQPIAPGGSHEFEFPINQKGTYWYHSHTDLQIQRGIYGPIVLTDPADRRDGIPPDVQQHTVLFSDWTDEEPLTVLNNLKREGDYYSLKKDAVQSWDRVLGSGSPAVKNRLVQSFTRMPPMDLADVGYDAFLVNGKREATLPVVDGATNQVLLRLINGSTSSYFDVEYAGGPMLVVAADGQDVEPLRVQRLRMSTAETYDVLVTVNPATAFELRATSVDVSGYSSLFGGNGSRVTAADIPRPNLLLMEHDGMEMNTGMEMAHAGTAETMHAPDAHAGHAAPAQELHAEHGQSMPMEMPLINHLTDYQNLVARADTSLPSANPWREFHLQVTGNMDRYVWSFNDETQRENPQIMIRKGENVRFHLTNATMMHHPLHLHGHFFRVVNGQGERSPLKHTANIPPMGEITIEFAANEDQDWLFHCHNQYHMKTGMNRVISYEGTSLFDSAMSAAILPKFRWFDATRVNLASNYAEMEYDLFEERNEFQLRLDRGYEGGHEVKAKYRYHFNRFLSGFVGAENQRHERRTAETLAIAGFNYTLPLLIDSEWRVDEAGDFRLELESELLLTNRLAFDWRWNTDNEYRYRLQFSLDKRWALTVNADSEYGDGIGMQYRF